LKLNTDRRVRERAYVRIGVAIAEVDGHHAGGHWLNHGDAQRIVAHVAVA
jgi:hypothetical protein